MKAVLNPKLSHYPALIKAFEHAISRAPGNSAPVLDMSMHKGEICLILGQSKHDSLGMRYVKVVVGKEVDELYATFFGGRDIMVIDSARRDANNGDEKNLLVEYFLQGFTDIVGPVTFNKRYSDLAFVIAAFLRGGVLPDSHAEMEEVWPDLAGTVQRVTIINKN